MYVYPQPDNRSITPPGGDNSGTTLINTDVRIYKGGSWKDRAYWMIPGNKRFLNQDLSTDHIGFRCAMHRLGTPNQNIDHSNN